MIGLITLKNNYKATLVALFIFFFFSLSIDAQDQFLEEEVSEILLMQINQLRKEKGLHPFERDEILDAVAFDQAEYILKVGKVTHEQEQAKKKTLLDRILYYEGLFAAAGENAMVVGVGSKEQIEPNGSRVLINSEANAVKAAITSWLDEKEGKLNLLDPNFYKVGTAVIIDEKNEITFVTVSASLPYQNPSSKKFPINFHGIEKYSDEVCKKFLEEHPTLPQLFSDAFKVEGREVFFEYHSLALVNEIIGSSSDGIAVDVIQRNQFSCEAGNRLVPTEICKGYLLPPAKRSRLMAYNLKVSEGEVKISLGQLPDFYSDKECELNGVIIKQGHYCETVPFNRVATKNIKWFQLPYLLVGDSDTTQFNWEDSTLLEVTNNSNSRWIEDLKREFLFLEEIKYRAKELVIHVSFSPIQDQREVIEKLREILEEQLPTLDYRLTSSIAWEEYFEFQKNTYHQLETKGMDTTQLRSYLATQTDQQLTSFLNGLNQIQLKLKGDATVDLKKTNEEKIDLLRQLIQKKKVDAALFIQSNLIKAVWEGKLEENKVPMTDPSQEKLTLPVINNQIVLKQHLGEKIYDGNSTHLAFLELFLIDQREPNIAFNKQLSQLKNWSENLKEVKDFKKWGDEFKKLSGKVPYVQYAKSLLNYYLIAANYYYEVEEFNDRKKAFEEIMKWQAKADLNNEELLNLAQYLCYQDQFSKAIELLLPFIKKETVDQEILFYFLQIAIYDEEIVNDALYLQFLKKAQNLYPNAFCSLFGKEKMGIQQSENLEVKELYCSNCQ